MTHGRRVGRTKDILAKHIRAVADTGLRWGRGFPHQRRDVGGAGGSGGGNPVVAVAEIASAAMSHDMDERQGRPHHQTVESSLSSASPAHQNVQLLGLDHDHIAPLADVHVDRWPLQRQEQGKQLFDRRRCAKAGAQLLDALEVDRALKREKRGDFDHREPR